MKDTTIYGCLLALVTTATLFTHAALDRVELPSPAELEETLPSPYATRLLSLGHYPLAADYYWMRSLYHFGDASMHQAKYPNLAPFIERALALDPYFKSVYFVAGTALTLKGMDHRTSIEILERGLKARPDVWEIPFYLGFNYYYFERNFALAAEKLALAAQHRESPSFTWGLSTRLSAEGQRPEVGLQLVNSILEDMHDTDPARTDYEERRDLLLLEVRLRDLQRSANAFAEVHGHPANSLADLLSNGILSSIPEEPLGGEFRIKEGTVFTTNEERRLRLSERARSDLEEKTR